MSSGNGFPGQPPSWPPQRPASNAQQGAERTQTPAWPPQQPAHAQPQSNAQPSWGNAETAAPGYANPAYQTASSAQVFGQPRFHALSQPSNAGNPQASYGAADPYAPQFAPYTAPTQNGNPGAQAAGGYHPQAYPARPNAAGVGAAPNGYAPAPRPGDQQAAYQAAHWNALQADQRGFEAAAYGAQPAPQASVASPHHQPAYRGTEPRFEPELAPAYPEWQGKHQQGGDFNRDSYAQQPTDEFGFAQASGGELDADYNDEDQDYEYEETPRRRRPFMIAAALAGALTVCGGLVFGYQAILGTSSSGEPPVIKSASDPSKTKPADAGGKLFAHSDSKIMGRLGEGSAAATAAAASSSDADASGTRKVSTLVVGRDGSIQAPVETASAEPAADTSGAVVVPGLTVVDAFGSHATPAKVASADSGVTVSQPQAINPDVEPAPRKLVVSPPKATQQITGSVEPESAPSAPVVPSKPAVKKIAAAVPVEVPDGAPAAPLSTATGANGYVAVLASVPRSASSRIEALKMFADMQQKYNSALTGKTPDVAEANLGAKGAYHRLVVGPPASREQASSLCSELKAQGYTACWVTAY